mmetsp:Transcript_73859/g.175818  ORF Transcript_73859/g.175818 Transcript_73859/m.175818 type:complete len:359 (+) Transcript_73859:91-1167(+)
MPAHFLDLPGLGWDAAVSDHSHGLGLWEALSHGLKASHVHMPALVKQHGAFHQHELTGFFSAGHGERHVEPESASHALAGDLLLKARRGHSAHAAAFLQGPTEDVGFGEHPEHSSFLPSVHPERLGTRTGSAVASSFLSSSFSSIQEKLHNVVLATPPSVLVPLHAASIVFAVPGHIAFELGEGYVFGLKKGFALAFTGKFLGAGASFAIGRSENLLGSMRTAIKDKMDAWPAARSVAQAVERGGAFSVFVIRLAPVPCVVKNYSLAFLTDIPASTYLMASFLGLAPTTAAHVFAGTLATSAADLVSGRMTQLQTMAAAAPVVAGVLLTLWAGWQLKQQMAAEEENEEEAGSAKLKCA